MNPFVITRWTRKKFESQPANLDFKWAKDWPLHHLPIAWNWELDRELGSNNLPFTVAWKKKHGDKLPEEEIKPAARFLPFHEVAQLYGFDIHCNFYEGSFPTTCHAVKIDLSRSVEEVLEDLKREIKRFKRLSSSLEHKPNRGRQRRDFLAWFRDLAIYRVSVSDVPEKQQSNVINGNSLFTKNPNWTHMRDASIERIEKRLHTLKLIAHIESTDGNIKGSPRWSDHFATLNSP